MRKVLFATWRRAVVICFVALIGMVWAVAAHAGPTQRVEGLWEYLPTIVSERLEECTGNPGAFTTIWTTTETGVWSGSFNGNSVEDGKVLIHCSGWWSFFAIVTFDDVEINGEWGGLYMLVDGARPDATADWCGTWTIVDGTRAHENLRGSGNWWGPGFIPVPPFDPGKIYYDGKIKWSDEPRHESEFDRCIDKICDDDDD